MTREMATPGWQIAEVVAKMLWYGLIRPAVRALLYGENVSPDVRLMAWVGVLIVIGLVVLAAWALGITRRSRNQKDGSVTGRGRGREAGQGSAPGEEHVADAQHVLVRVALDTQRERSLQERLSAVDHLVDVELLRIVAESSTCSKTQMKAFSKIAGLTPDEY
jgi:hypothetical protein